MSLRDRHSALRAQSQADSPISLEVAAPGRHVFESSIESIDKRKVKLVAGAVGRAVCPIAVQESVASVGNIVGNPLLPSQVPPRFQQWAPSTREHSISPPLRGLERPSRNWCPFPFPSMALAAASRSLAEDLTIPELFHALKQRLSGISSYHTGYVFA